MNDKKLIRLNIGCGDKIYPDMINIDLFSDKAEVKMDARYLNFEKNSVDEIYGAHIFEHFPPFETIDILRRWHDILVPGGKLVLEMPDIKAICENFVTADKSKRYDLLNCMYAPMSDLSVPGHFFGWYDDILVDHFLETGYINIDIESIEDETHMGYNLRATAYKPNDISYKEPVPEITVIEKVTLDHESLNKQDPHTYLELFIDNSYRVTDQDIMGKTVIDIGANIGLFSLLCLEKGAKEIIAVEAQPKIYNLYLLDNIENYPRIKPRNYAVYGNDNQTIHIKNEKANSMVGGSEGDIVKTITLKTLLERENIQGNDIVLKMDCEGSEFEILENCSSDLLRRFSTIFIEIHGNIPPYKDVNIVRNIFTVSDFELSSSIPIVTYHDTYEEEIGVYVEKWVHK